MTKTFKNRVSVRDAESVLEITDTPAGIRLTVREEYGIVHGWFAPKQGAEIALAILEAAGVENVPHDIADGSERALGYLIEHVGLQQANERHAKEQEELEAEAQELFKASGAYGSDRPFLKFSDLDDHVQKAWLAVARKARELGGRAEK